MSCPAGGAEEQALARGFALLESLFDPDQLLVGGGEAVDVADEPGEVGPVVVRPGPVGTGYLGVLHVDQGLQERGEGPPPHRGRDTTGAGSRHLLDRGATGGEPAGAGRDEVGAELGDTVVVMADQDVAKARAVLGGHRGVLGVVVEHPDEGGVDVGSGGSGDLAHPLAAVRRADPQGAIDPECLRPQGAPVHEHVLAGVRPKALAEQHHPGAAVGGPVAEAFEDVQHEQAVLLAGCADPAQGQRGRALGVLQGHRGHVAEGEVLGGSDGAVVHIAGSGGRDEHEQ